MTASRQHDNATLKHTRQFLKQQKAASGRFLSFSLTSGFANGLALIAQAWLLSSVVTKAVFKHQPLEQLWFELSLLLGIFVVRAILAWLTDYFALHAAAKIKQHLRRALYERFHHLAVKKLAAEDTGSLINSWLEGIDSMHDYYARYFPAMALTVAVPLAIWVFILPSDWVSALIMVITAPLIPLFMIFIGKGTEKLNQKQWRKLSFLSSYFLDIVQGMTTLKLFNASRREAAMVRQISKEYRLETMKVLRVAFLSSFTLEFFSTVSIALIALFIGFRLMWGEMDFKHGFFVLLLAPEFYLPLRRMGVYYHARLQAIGAAEHMIRLFSETVEPHHGTQKPSMDAPHIVFHNVTYAYGHKTILNNVSLEILPGKATGLTGVTGSGKTTLMAMLLGFLHPQQGYITVNGLRFDEINLDEWRRQLGWVPQSPNLISGTIRDNILMGNASIDDSVYAQICRDLSIDTFTATLPDKDHTLLGEKGHGLSGGQIQRIALARALVRQSSLLLLDEPTAHLDATTEQIIDQALNKLTQRTTRFIIAHRPATIQAMDVVYHLENGIITQVTA